MTQQARAVYEEKPRGYGSLWVFAAILGVGFVFDLSLGGGVAHLPGWAIAFALVLGVNSLVVYSVRSVKSLRLTDAELRVGDEGISRADIVGVAGDVDETDLPVLGWPMGRPRILKALTVRLSDGRDVIVPTRYPDRLQAALGIDAVHGPASGQGVRAAARADLALLADIEVRAGALFRTAGYRLPDVPDDPGRLGRAEAVFVAGRPPIGFVEIGEVDGLAYIEEIAVVPKWMRQGVGTQLLERACEWARTHGYAAITLITYADVPWNGPFYAANGFVEVGELTPGLVARREREREFGLDEVGPRIAMRCDLATWAPSGSRRRGG